MVRIKVNKKLTALAGWEYGLEVYKKQVPSIYKGSFIVFPDHIKRVAESFVEAFIRDILIKGLENDVDIISSNKRVSDKFKKALTQRR